jgi:4-hydroxy-tetrahydrodipicolinate reductase
MAEIRTVVAGASGRMGRTLLRLISESDSFVLVGGLERKGHSDLGKDLGILAGAGASGIVATDDALALLARADALLDFTTPEVSVSLSELAAQARICHVIGTTGCSQDDEKRIRASARHAVIVKSGNMSLGVNLLASLVKKAAKALPDFDIEIVEMHHRLKVDAPSGTALLLGQAASEGRDISLAEKSVRARDGHTGIRSNGAIGFASLRGGTVVGEHKVILAGPQERIELSHTAEDRAIFARGALAAARWGQGKKPGLYSMADVLDLSE